MIGQKGFFKTNSNVNANLGDAIISSGSTPTPTPPPAPHIPNLPSSDATPAGNAQPAPAQTKKPLNIKTILIIIVAAIAGAGIAVGVILLLNHKGGEDGETKEITYASPDNDGTQTVAETVAEFDRQIAEAKENDVELGLKLNKVGYYMLNDDYESALGVLEGINVSQLDDFDQYRVYNHYASVYKGLGNSTKAAEYQKLAEAANSRDFSSEGNVNE